MKAIILGHLKGSQVVTVGPKRAIEALRAGDIGMIVLMVGQGKDVDLPLICDIKRLQTKAPLLVYGHLSQMHTNFVELLDMGVHGILSSHAARTEHIHAIDALMRGNSYVDVQVKFQAMIRLLQSDAQ
nr:hypothetical protein [uncultured Dyadobacter sp.]